MVEEDGSAISLNVDLQGAGDCSSSTSSRQVTPARFMLRKLHRTLHCVTSTLTTQDTFASTGSSNVFKRASTKVHSSPCRSNTFSSPGFSITNSNTLDSSSQAGLWYNNIKSPLKMSKKLLSGVLHDFQDRTTSFGFSSSPRTYNLDRWRRGGHASDADDLQLNDYVYTGSGNVRPSSSLPRTLHNMSCTSELEDEAFDCPGNTRSEQGGRFRSVHFSNRTTTRSIPPQIGPKSKSCENIMQNVAARSNKNANKTIQFNNFL